MFDKLYRYPIPTRREFVLRMLRRLLWFVGVLAFSLGIGMVGYHVTESLDWIDALLNASMILTGMGQVATLQTAGGKLFASAYALFSGIVFLTSMAVILAPVVHRLFHKIHLELWRDAEDDGADDGLSDDTKD